jgi:nitrogen fixation protein
MVDKVTIINGALGLVGGEAISAIPTNINDASVANRSRWGMRLYPIAYESVLGAWPWNDARRRRQLNKSGEAPAFDYSNQYELEEDVLRVVAVRSQGYPWEREGRFVLCDCGGSDTDSKLNALTIVRVPEEQLMGQVAAAVSAELAHRISMAVNDSQNRKDAAKKDARDALIAAAQSDGWEASAQQLLASGWYLAAKTSYAPDDLWQPRPGYAWLES